jgi:Dyp-type peroxidase family
MLRHLRSLRGPSLELDHIQATVLRERPAPYFGTHALIEITDQHQGRELIRRITPRITSAKDWDAPRSAWTAIAITYTGLVALGVPSTSLASFPTNFRQGMAARADRLRDRGPNDPKQWEEPFGTGRVHAAITVFASDEGAWREEVAAYEEKLKLFSGITVLSRQDFGAQPETRNAFGYKDGIAQPVVEGSGDKGYPGDGRPIKAGEFVLGYESEAGTVLPLPQPEALGRNGTFLVFRKYHSHVAAFNRFLYANAKTEEERELLAAKLVGRWRSGAPLALAADHDDSTLGDDPSRNNHFTYARDPHGLQTPLGSHIRRMKPRDTKLAVLSNVNIRRIIRRSTTYGTPLAKDALNDDGQPRGLDFIAIGARAIDTVEFLQSEWINSGNFVSLGTEKDPMLGIQDKNASFTIPGSPPRRVHSIETFNTLRGGEYFFLPSLRALQWIGDLS